MKVFNIQKVIKVFEDNYVIIPLEVFTDDPFKTLISTLLSSRTKDEITLVASKKLFRKAPNIYKLSLLDQLEIKNLIFPVGFYNTKACHLTKLAEIIVNNYQGKVPHRRTDLQALPGVGRKTANLVLNRAFKIPAIAVDTHVHKISNLLGWVKTKNPIDTEKELVRIIPKKYWKDINRLFVSIGRQYRSTNKLTKFLIENKLLKEKKEIKY